MQVRGRQICHAVPTDKERHKLDGGGRKFYFSSALGFKIANYEFITADYQLFLWEPMLPFLELQPEDKRPLAKVLLTEAMRFLSSKLMLGSIPQMQWLISTTLPTETKYKVDET